MQDLLEGMRNGDRGAAAEFVTRYGSRIRRRVRGKLGRTMRRVFDSQEILSTIGRRLDLFVGAGMLNAAAVPQLWALIFKMADNALIDKVRVFRRLESAEGSDNVFANDLLSRLKTAERASATSGVELEIDEAIRSLRDRTDREILFLWLHGKKHTEISEHLGIAATNVRKRWEKIKSELRDRFVTRRV